MKSTLPSLVLMVALTTILPEPSHGFLFGSRHYEVQPFEFELLVPERLEVSAVTVSQVLVYNTRYDNVSRGPDQGASHVNELSSTFQRNGERLRIEVGGGSMDVPDSHPDSPTAQLRACQHDIPAAGRSRGAMP